MFGPFCVGTTAHRRLSLGAVLEEFLPHMLLHALEIYLQDRWWDLRIALNIEGRTLSNFQYPGDSYRRAAALAAIHN